MSRRDAGGKLQAADLDGGEDAQDSVTDLEHVIGLLWEHHEHEERFVFPRVRTFEPTMIDEPEAEHREIERRLDVAGEAIAAVRSAGDGDAWLGAGVALNRRFNELVAVSLAHHAREEVTILPATWEHSCDAELGAMQGAIVASIPPDRYGEWLTWMLRGLSRPELVGMFAGARASAPPPALEGMTRLAEATLGQARWAWLSGLPPQPGREAPGGQREGKQHEHTDDE